MIERLTSPSFNGYTQSVVGDIEHVTITTRVYNNERSKRIF